MEDDGYFYLTGHQYSVVLTVCILKAQQKISFIYVQAVSAIISG